MKVIGSLILVLAVVVWIPVQLSADNLNPPELDTPKDKAKNQVPTTVLKWKPVAGAKGYRVMVTLSPDNIGKLAPGAACADCLVDQKVDAPTFQIPPKLLNKKAPYYWTVRALAETGESPNAQLRSYTLASIYFADMD